MSLEEFIITVFCWVDDCFEPVTDGMKLRTRGFAPRLSDSEVITMELVGYASGSKPSSANSSNALAWRKPAPAMSGI